MTTGTETDVMAKWLCPTESCSPVVTREFRYVCPWCCGFRAVDLSMDHTRRAGRFWKRRALGEDRNDRV